MLATRYGGVAVQQLGALILMVTTRAASSVNAGRKQTAVENRLVPSKRRAVNDIADNDTKSSPSSSSSFSSKKGSTKFPYDLPYKQLDLRAHPHLYRTGIGEQGVLMVEPYKSEMSPHWRFKNPAVATESSQKLLSMFESYVREDDFVGADLARKFIQMGFTRSRRYANHKGGRKYVDPPPRDGRKHTPPSQRGEQIPRLDLEDQDQDKVQAAAIFKACLDDKVWTHTKYIELRTRHQAWCKTVPTPSPHDPQVVQAMSDPK